MKRMAGKGVRWVLAKAAGEIFDNVPEIGYGWTFGSTTFIINLKINIMNDLKNAVVKSTGKNVNVYRSKLRDTWIDFEDCKTEYKPKELSFD